MSQYDDLAALFVYPDDEGLKLLHPALDAIEGLESFAAFVRNGPVEPLEELFTRTFDISPVASLEVGWHLYGEDYSRGAFLVRMRGLMREHGVPESVELPDHLTHALTVLGRLKGEEADELACAFVLPALTKILAAFEGKESPYEAPLRAVQRFLRDRHGEETERGEVTAQPYAGLCGGCSELKKGADE